MTPYTDAPESGSDRPTAGEAASPGRIRRGSIRPFRPELPDTLRTLYDRYCEIEARDLLPLLPREGLRALWGRIRDREGRSGTARPPGEPPPEALRLLREEARLLLPLPPYHAWVGSYLSNRKAYLERLEVPSAPDRAGPVTVAVRPLPGGWWAHLNLERKESRWSGHLSFHGNPEGMQGAAVRRTVDIFLEESPDEIRERFRSFSVPTLEAFFRSVSP